jgi:hypothetical protein
VLLRQLRDLPERDRFKALELEMGPVPKGGINAEEWLRGRAQTFSLARWLILMVTVTIVLGLAAFVYLKRPPPSVVFGGRATLDGLPLVGATIKVIGVNGEWRTDQNGGFRGEIPDNLSGDSIALTVLYAADLQNKNYDTTLAKRGADVIILSFATEANHAISGQVIEARTGQPISGASITVSGDRGSGRTDVEGHFRFAVRGKPFERVQATVSHPNYQTRTLGLTVAEEHRITLSRRRP